MWLCELTHEKQGHGGAKRERKRIEEKNTWSKWKIMPFFQFPFVLLSCVAADFSSVKHNLHSLRSQCFELLAHLVAKFLIVECTPGKVFKKSSFPFFLHFFLPFVRFFWSAEAFHCMYLKVLNARFCIYNISVSVRWARKRVFLLKPLLVPIEIVYQNWVCTVKSTCAHCIFEWGKSK